MEAKASFSFETPLNEWRNYLQDLNFWLNGYQNTSAYSNLKGKVDYAGLQWNLGIPPTSSFTRTISSITCERKIKTVGPFDHVIKVDLNQATTLGSLDIVENLVVRVAEELDLLRQEDDEIGYYSYNQQERTAMSLRNKLRLFESQINQKLTGRKYLLVVENVYKPVESVDFTLKVRLPPWEWNNSRWIISTTSQDVYAKSNLGDPRFRQQPDKAVKVSGERAWWAELSWDKDSYEPRLAPAFASHRERVVIESYLR